MALSPLITQHKLPLHPLAHSSYQVEQVSQKILTSVEHLTSLELPHTQAQLLSQVASQPQELALTHSIISPYKILPHSQQLIYQVLPTSPTQQLPQQLTTEHLS